MKPKHSPLPWKVKGAGISDYYARTMVVSSQGLVTNTASHIASPTAEEANARFIVQACNNFDSLLDACRLALDESPWQPLGEDIRTVLRTAIAKVERR